MFLMGYCRRPRSSLTVCLSFWLVGLVSSSSMALSIRSFYRSRFVIRVFSRTFSSDVKLSNSGVKWRLYVCGGAARHIVSLCLDRCSSGAAFVNLMLVYRWPDSFCSSDC